MDGRGRCDPVRLLLGAAMASISWPYDLCEVETDEHEIDDADNVRRTSFEDGFIEQKRINTKGLKLRRLNVVVPIASIPDFRQWVETNGTNWFNFVDPEDKMTRDCRVQGGKIPLRRAAERMANGSVFYRGLAVLEGY